MVGEGLEAFIAEGAKRSGDEIPRAPLSGLEGHLCTRERERVLGRGHNT